MINDLDIVQWGYLLDPAFQLINSAGKPLTNGYIEVYYHGTRNKYYCASDFDGTLHPFKIPLDSLGSNIVLADPGYSYDIYIYNAFGSLVMSRYNVTPGKGGEGGGGGIPGSEMPEHWLGMYGATIQIPGTAEGTTLPVPTGNSVDYEGDFIDHISDNKYIYLKEGLYLVECVIRFEQSSSDLKNELGEVLVYTGRGNANEDQAWQEDLSGPDANDNRHCLKMSFIRLVKDGTHHGDSSVLYFAPGSHVDWTWAQIQNLSIVKLGAGGGSAYKYLPGDFITIENRIISATGLLPAAASANFVTNDAFNETVNNIYGDINNVSSVIEGDINAVTTVIEGQITNVTGDIVNIHNDITYVSAAIQEATVSGIPRSELAAVSGVLENDIQTVSAAIPEAQVNADWNATSGKAEILNKPDLTVYATHDEVAGVSSTIEGDILSVSTVIEGDIQTVSAAVDSVSAAMPETEEVEFEELDVDSLVTNDDLTAVTSVIENTIETVSSTLDDKIDAVSAAVPEAQVNADWDAVSGKAEILNKPDLSIYATHDELETVSGTLDDKIDSVSASLPDTEEVTFEELDVDSFATHDEVSAVVGAVSSVIEGDISAVSTEIMNIVEGVSATIEGDIQSVSTTIEGDISSVSTVLQNNIEGVSATIINNIEGDLVTVSTVLEGDIQTVSAALDAVSASIPELPQEEEVEFEELDVDSLVTDNDLSAVTSVIENTIETVSGTLDDKIDAVSAAVPAAQVNADWNATSGKAEILNKPDLSVYATHDEVAGATSVIENTIEGDLVTVSTVLEGDIQTVSSALNSVSASIPDAQVQSDWTEADDTKKSYIQHKPVSKSLVAGDNIHILETASSVIISSDNGPVTGMATEAELASVSGTLQNEIQYVSGAIPEAQVNADWDAVSGKAEILNKPDTYGLVAGSNVTITVSGDDLIISAIGGGSVTGAVTEAELIAVSGNLESDIQTVSSAIPDVSNLATKTEVNAVASDVQTVSAAIPELPQEEEVSFEELDVDSFATETELQTVSAAIPELPQEEEVSFEELDVDSFATETELQTVSAAIPAAQVNSDWNATSGVAEILNKPTETDVIAGQGITITESASGIVISSTGGGGTSYQAGDYIAISGNTISVTGLDNSDIFWVTSDSIQKDVIDAYNAGKHLFYISYGKSYPLGYVNIVSGGIEYHFYFWGFYNPQQSTPRSIWAWHVTALSISSSAISTSGSGLISLQADWNETNTLNPSYIRNKPDLSVYETKAGNAAVSAILEADIQIVSAAIQGGGTEYSAGNYIAIENDTIAVTGLAPQVQANWNETNTSSKSYIQNKPSPTTLSSLNTAGITDIQLVNALPASPVSSVLYLIPEA